MSDFYNKTVELFKKQVHVVRVIIGLIIILTISNTLTMTVLERTTEIDPVPRHGLGPGAIKPGRTALARGGSRRAGRDRMG